jgi:hypothetical protein
MNRDNDERRTMIKGLVIPVDWDQTGKVRTVGVLTDDEGEYEVASGGASGQLMMHLRREILADGVLLDAVGSVKRVRVESFAILDWRSSDNWSASGGS